MDHSADIPNRYSRYTIIGHLSFWLILFTFPFTAALQTEHWTVAFSWAIMPLAFQIGAAYVNIHLLIPRFFKARKFWLYALSMIVILSLVPLIMNFWAENVFDRDAMAQRLFNRNNMSMVSIPPVFKFIPPVLITVIVLFISSSYTLAIDFMKKECGPVLLEQQKVAAELKALRSQMNPHFIFNALNNLNAVSKVNPERTELFIERLSEMMRYVMGPSSTDGVSLAVELSSIESYLFFQKEKDPEHTHIHFTQDIEDDSAVIEPMLIIPLLENAFKHGYRIDGGPLEVHIHLCHKNNSTRVRVRNTIPQAAPDQPHDPSHTGIGLANIRQRLAYRYPDSHLFEIEEDAGYFNVKMDITHD